MHAFTSAGYNSDALKKTIMEIPSLERQTITGEHTQEHYDILAKSNTHGKLFSATGGTHITSDNIFISAEMATREKEEKRLTTEKNKRLRQMKVKDKGKAILDAKGYDCTRWNKTDLNAVLAWYNLPKRAQMTSREEKEGTWNCIQLKGQQPPVCEPWTDDDEKELLEASNVEISLGDTALGRVQQRKQH